MNTYRIEVDFSEYVPGEPEPVERTANFEVGATHREAAVYNMFDEMTDHGYTVTRLGDVYLLNEGVATLILPHQAAANV